MKRVDSYVRFMIDNGLIFEINRKVLHPLGYALDVGIHPTNSKWLTIKGLLKVEDGDEEGFVFDEETFKVGIEKYKEFIEKEGDILESRKDKLGYLIQEESDDS